MQNLALSGEIRDADQVWVTTLKLMVCTWFIQLLISKIRLDDCVASLQGTPLHFHGKHGLGLLLRILRQSPLHDALIRRIGTITNDPDLRIRATVKSIPFKPKHKDGRNPSFSKTFWHVFSIFGAPYDPELNLIPKTTECELLDHQNLALDTSRELYGRRNDSFLQVEDRLLLLGVQRFGLGNWEKLQSYMLPTRTARQLQNRFKNLTSRCAPSNPIKDFLNEILKPLSRAEEELLLQGVHFYGDDWIQISARFLPHRPPSILRRLYLKRRPTRPEKVKILELEFPSEDEDDSDY